MTTSRELGVGFACVVVMCGMVLGGWLLHRHAVEAKLSAAANEIRVRAETGDAAAQNKLGNLYLTGRGVRKGYAEAVLWYRKGAEQGNAKAQFNLGEMYALGYGVPKNYAEALQWLNKSADQADTRAESNLGYLYFNGQGATRDECQGFAWYRKAADAGYLTAQQFVGWMYYNGRGVNKDYTQAAAWYEKAAAQGDAVSQAWLGYMYSYGIGVERDRIGSMRWYRMAAAQGEPSARQYLSSLKPSTTKRHIELGLAVIESVAGVIFLLPTLDFLLPGRKLRGWQQVVIAILGVDLLVSGWLSYYACAHDISYSPYHAAFYFARRILFGIAIVILFTTVLSAKKKLPDPTPAGA